MEFEPMLTPKETHMDKINLTNLSCFPYGDNDGEDGNTKNAWRIDFILVIVPQDDTEQLEDVEWRQHLHKQGHWLLS